MSSCSSQKRGCRYPATTGGVKVSGEDWLIRSMTVLPAEVSVFEAPAVAHLAFREQRMQQVDNKKTRLCKGILVLSGFSGRQNKAISMF